MITVLRLVFLATLCLAPLMSAQPIIVGHRGSPAAAPENTLPSFQQAWADGADAIEGDFHLTRDRQIVCIHDEDTARFRGPNLKVRKTKLADLQAIDAGSWRGEQWAGTSVPKFSDILATVPPGKLFYIEIKSSPKILRHLFREIDASGIDPKQLVIIAFSPRVIKKSKQLRPDITANWLTSLKARTKGGLEPSSDKILATLKRIRADGVSMYRHKAVDEDFVRPILGAGYQLHVWTVNDLEDARRWRDLGASSITTNLPALLKSEL